MATKLFVAGLSYSMTDSDLSNLFADYGAVTSAQVITERGTNQSKGFGFVEMSTEDESKSAIKGLNGKEMDGRPLIVNEARTREERSSNSHTSSTGNNYRRARASTGKILTGDLTPASVTHNSNDAFSVGATLITHIEKRLERTLQQGVGWHHVYHTFRARTDPTDELHIVCLSRTANIQTSI